MSLSDDDKPVPRRRFFREGLLELFKPLARSVEPMARVAEQIGALDQPAPPPKAPERHWLRPPGSLPEEDFRNQCSRCADCVRVCPVQCIKIDYSLSQGEGYPYIDPDLMSCVMCTELACMHHCPSGALQPVLFEYVDMGVAQWHESTCLRSEGDNCQICVDACPVGARALVVGDDGRVDVREGCTGCGTCQHACPTRPRSITVLPKSAR
jgi:ferredoxin-type protein NapG